MMGFNGRLQIQVELFGFQPPLFVVAGWKVEKAEFEPE